MKYSETINTLSCGNISDLKNRLEQLYKFSFFMAYETSQEDALEMLIRLFDNICWENSKFIKDYYGNGKKNREPLSFLDKYGKKHSFKPHFKSFTNIPMSGWRLSYVKTHTKLFSCVYKYVLTHPTDDDISFVISQFEELIPFLNIIDGVIQDSICFYYHKGNLCASMEGTSEFEYLYHLAHGSAVELRNLEQGDTFLMENKHNTNCVYLGEYFISQIRYRGELDKPVKKHFISFLNEIDNTYYIKAVSNIKNIVKTGSIESVAKLSMIHTIIGSKINTKNEYLSMYNGTVLAGCYDYSEFKVLLSKSKSLESFKETLSLIEKQTNRYTGFSDYTHYSAVELFQIPKVLLNEE